MLSLPKFLGFGKVQNFVDDSQQAIPSPQKGKETVKKYKAGNAGSRKRFLTHGCA
jgi:hypothetical protein